MALIQNFIEERFPEDISYGSSGGPSFRTTIQPLSSGHETRNIDWTAARAKYHVNHAVKTPQQIKNLVSFWRMVRGAAIGFRFKDWTDYIATGELIGTGDAVVVNFQLNKNYTFGLGTLQYDRIITKPVSGTITVYEDGIANGLVTIDTTTGIVTFPVAPAGGVVITADFEFDVPSRFQNDEMNITLDHALISTWSSIDIIEIR